MIAFAVYGSPYLHLTYEGNRKRAACNPELLLRYTMPLVMDPLCAEHMEVMCASCLVTLWDEVTVVVIPLDADGEGIARQVRRAYDRLLNGDPESDA